VKTALSQFPPWKKYVSQLVTLWRLAHSSSLPPWRYSPAGAVVSSIIEVSYFFTKISGGTPFWGIEPSQDLYHFSSLFLVLQTDSSLFVFSVAEVF
jgi:hypothetical protein